MDARDFNPSSASNPISKFDLKEFLDAGNDATNRTRYVYIVLLVATILIFIGLNNSYVNSWMVDDLRQAYKPGDDYIKGVLQPTDQDEGYFRDSPVYDEHRERVQTAHPADLAKRDVQQALVRMHMESRLLLKIPILGLAIHVNDLGFLGGITLIVLLLLTRTSLSREIKNLGFSFKRAVDAEQLDAFYEALALRQLFTVPQMKGEKRNRFLSKAPYAVCLLPVLVYFMLVTYDVYTVLILPRYKHGLEGKSISELLRNSSILWLMIIEGLCAFVIAQIALRCLERQHYLYTIWDSYWQLLDAQKHSLCLLEPEVVAGLMKDGTIDSEEINGLLRKVKENTEKPTKLNLPRRIWRAFKEENSPILDFLFLKRRSVGKPLLIEIDPDLAEQFSNDKQINDTLRKILKRREYDHRKQAAD